MDPVLNPYAPGAGTRPPALTGRDREIDQFRIYIQRVQLGRPEKSLILVGLRGVGKTVLLNRFADIAEGFGTLCAQAEMAEHGDFTRRIAEACDRVLRLLNKPKLSKRIRSLMDRLGSVRLKLPDGPEVEFGIKPRDTSDSYASDILGDVFIELAEAASEQGTAVLLLLDEMQYLNETDLSSLISAIHRVTQASLPLALVGAGLPQLPRLVGDARSYAERLFDFPAIGALNETDASLALEQPASNLGVQFEYAASALVVNITHGYPYFLQEFGKHVWNRAKTSPITVNDVESARLPVETHLDQNFFRVRIDRATAAEKRYLRAMAELGAGPYKSGDIADVLGVKVNSLGPVRAKLINKGFIYSSAHGMAAFTVPLFDDFMRRSFHGMEDLKT